MNDVQQPPNGNRLHRSEELKSELELYGDPGIATYDEPVPKFLKLTYITLPIWGVISFMIFYNGSVGWFDRGYWHELQVAANTTMPAHNSTFPAADKALQKEALVSQAETD
jgi:hypothetical protein